ncbi:hypothetical protein ACIQOW_12455 [Kitasatospora sp. NPDC091335]|uniref:hypothetical protein n=1 Tax=Kitasatospora sp. NPDC091335 TaxID=3364085 RepID=UPI00382DD674
MPGVLPEAGATGRLRAQERFAVEPVTVAFREIHLEPVSQYPAFPGGGGGGGAGPAPRPFARPAGYWPARTAERRPCRPSVPSIHPGSVG